VTATTDWLTAVGTVGAVIVAVGTPSIAMGWRHYSRPKLELQPENTNPSDIVVMDAVTLYIAGYDLRLAVHNRGLREATGVRAQVRRFWAGREVPVSGKTWAQSPIDPIPLTWASRPNALPIEQRESVSLPPGARDVAAFAVFRCADRRMDLVRLGVALTPVAPQQSVLHEYRFELAVTADNAQPVTEHFWCTTPIGNLDVGHAWPTIEELGVGADVPPEADTEMLIARRDLGP